MTANPLSVWFMGVSGIAVIGLADYLTGTELRISPLYYGPISLIAWYRTRSDTLVAVALSALAWLVSNYYGGLRFSSGGIWTANMLLLVFSFATVGLLIVMLKAALTREQALSRTDALTSLPNRRAFGEDANRLLAQCRREGQAVTLAYIDLDNFKTVNDTYGHAFGDDLLRTLGKRLQAFARASDLPVRLGGDEFAILFPGLDKDGAAPALNRLQSVLAGIVAPDQKAVAVSIGAVTFAKTPDTVDRLLLQADLQMYQAKTQGKNRVNLQYYPA